MRPEIQALLRRDFLSFLHKAFATVEPSVKFRPNWHHQAIAHALTEVADGACRRPMAGQFSFAFCTPRPINERKQLPRWSQDHRGQSVYSGFMSKKPILPLSY
jgi:hypothetical protein